MYFPLNFMSAFLLPFLLLHVLPAHAAEWVRVHTSGEGDQYFYDRSKLFISGDEITYWKKVNFRSPQPVKNQFAMSGLFRERIHCAEHTLKLISYLLYSADGATIEYVASTEGDAAPIIPDTLGDIFEKASCELVRQKHLELRRKSVDEPPKADSKKPAEIPPIVPVSTPAEGQQSAPSSPISTAPPATPASEVPVAPGTR